MLLELVVTDLGVIERGSVVFGPRMTALTGETGAGKTLVVEAISLLLGGRSEPHLVRVGADEARVDGRFVVASTDEEIVLSRVIPRSGRSRAYVDGRPVPVAALQELGLRLVDLHGQHAHQSLLSVAAQRNALDAFGAIDLTGLRAEREQLRTLLAEQQSLGGDARARAREIDLLGFQVDEIDRAEIASADEDVRAAETESVLADASAHREAGRGAVEALQGDGGAGELLGSALRLISSRPVFASITERLQTVMVEVSDLADSVRLVADRIDDDPETLDTIRRRRQALRDLRRKYGDTLDAVLNYREESATRLDELLRHDSRSAVIAREIAQAENRVSQAFREVVERRTACASELATQVERRLADLAMPHARLSVEVSPEAHGDGDVTFLLSANPGGVPLPLSKVASGGELARIMLALRLTLLDGRSLVTGDPPETLLFDEVDAGIGGETAGSVGAALAAMATRAQVIVVTHLAQVASFADAHVLVRKSSTGRTTNTVVAVLDPDDRVTELARMISGSPDSASAREHAVELLNRRSSAPVTQRTKSRKRTAS